MAASRLNQGFRIGEWTVDPQSNRLYRNGASHSLEPRIMDLLVFLAAHSGKTVSKDEIFSAVWADTFVTDSALWKCVSELRQILEDDPKDPRLIITVARRGYRLRAKVEILSEEPEGSNSSIRRRLTVVGVAAGAALAFALFGWFPRSDVARSTDAPQSRPTILIARLDNRTGDELLDGTVEIVLEGRLNDSGRAQVVSRSRVEDTLRLMRERVDEPLTARLARQVSLRDGDVDFVLAGQVDSLGSRYHLTLRLLDGQSHELVASNGLQTETREGLLALADDQAFWLLGRLGVETPKREAQPERVTTRSLEALSLYTRGVALYQGSPGPEFLQRQTEAAQLFVEATRLDPDFASAHLMLAWSRFMIDSADPELAAQQGIVYERGQELVTRPAWEAMQRAMESRVHASLVERAFIQGCFLHWQGKLREAIPFYRLAADLQPEHRWAANNLMRLASELQDSKVLLEASLARARAARLEDLGFALRTVVLLSADLQAAREVRGRMSRLSELEPYPAPQERPDGTMVDRRHQAIATLRAFDVWASWREGKYSEANAALAPLAESVAELHENGTEVANNGYAFALAEMQMAMGRLKGALATQQRYELHPWDGHWADWSWGSAPAEFLALLNESPEPLGEPGLPTVLWGVPLHPGFVTAGQIEEFELLGPMTRKLALALHSSRPEDRIAGLRDRIAAQRPGWTPVGHLRWKLARELSEQGRDDEAVQILEEIVAAKNRTFSAGVVIWQKAALDLASLYRKQGRVRRAEPLLSELAAMLQFADSDHPILLQMQSMRVASMTPH